MATKSQIKMRSSVLPRSSFETARCREGRSVIQANASIRRTARTLLRPCVGTVERFRIDGRPRRGTVERFGIDGRVALEPFDGSLFEPPAVRPTVRRFGIDTRASRGNRSTVPNLPPGRFRNRSTVPDLFGGIREPWNGSRPAGNCYLGVSARSATHFRHRGRASPPVSLGGSPSDGRSRWPDEFERERSAP